MRYKSSRNSIATGRPTTKNGHPDMRYKNRPWVIHPDGTATKGRPYGR